MKQVHRYDKCNILGSLRYTPEVRSTQNIHLMFVIKITLIRKQLIVTLGKMISKYTTSN